jgi:hypothetical protein
VKKKQWFVCFRQLVSIVLIFGLVSCQLVGIKDEETENTHQVEKIKKIEVVEDVPEFSPWALYTVCREYEYKKNNHVLKKEYILETDSLITGFDKFLEDRLIDLYPDATYKGMLVDIYQLDEITNCSTLAKATEIDTNDFIPFTTIEAEIELMNMSEAEIEFIMALEELASGNSFTIEELYQLTPLSKQTVIPVLAWLAIGAATTAAIIALIKLIGAAVDRVYLCETRTYEQRDVDNQYIDNIKSGQKGDAFKHIFMSMQLRECLGQVSSWAAMGIYEETHENTFYGDTQMDYHNNKVGRKNLGQYKLFLKDEEGNKGTYEDWADRVKEYIDNDDNSAYFNWEFEIPHTEDSTIKDDVNGVSIKKYVYYATKEQR